MAVNNNRHDGRSHRQLSAETAGSQRADRRHDGGRGDIGPVITNHAHERWSERAATTAMGVATAWRHSVSVTAPKRRCDHARLYAPEDLLLLGRNGVIATVCPANYDSLETNQLGRCGECGNLDRFDSDDSECRWCGSCADTLQLSGGVVVSFGGEE